MKILPILMSSLLILATTFKDCNFTQFDFFSHYSLGQQDELNSTFNAVNKQIATLPAVQLKTNASVVYRVSNATARFRYLDGQQKAEVVDNDIIYIRGGKAETYLNFTWFKDQQQGVGTAICLTDQLSFAKLLYLDNGFMIYKLADNNNISYYNTPCNVTRVEPVIQPTELAFITELLNNNSGSNVKSKIIDEAMKYYQKDLNSSLYDERFPINNHSEYSWSDSTKTKNITINYTMLPTGSHLGPTGLSLNFVTQITDDDLWRCGPSVPSAPKDPKVYGGIQQYLSMSIIQNTIRFAAQKGVLNTQLTRELWESMSFQFFAGDLYDVIPQLTKQFYADAVIDGSCNVSSTGETQASVITDDTFVVSLPYSCELKISSTMISQFEVNVKFNVQIDPQQDSLNFKVAKADKMAQFKDVGVYQIHDIELANYFLSKSLQRLREGRVFGSGWKIYARDYPKAILQNGYLFLYDASGRV